MPDRKVKILMVCLGNICRSPLAQGILESKLDPTKYEVQSAGTGDFHIGKQPDPRSIAVARKNGLDITKQKAAQFKTSDFDYYNYIFAMDSSNYENIIALARNDSDKNKVKLILNEISDNTDAEVPDPYYGGTSGFNHVYELLDNACDRIAERI